MRRERGLNWVICDRCGIKYGNHQCSFEPVTNAYVCKWCKDTINEVIKYQYKSKDSFPTFQRIPPEFVAERCSTTSQSGIVGVGIVGCMIVGNNNINPYYLGIQL
jgi:hypothetical protein